MTTQALTGFSAGLSNLKLSLMSALVPVSKFAFWVVVFVYVYSVGFNSLTHGGHYSPDSVVYKNTADNILAGNGVVNSMLPLDEAVAMGSSLPVATTAYAPAYPVAIALASKVTGMPTEKAALFVAVVCLGVFLVLSYYTIKNLFGVPAGLIGVALLTQFTPMLHVASHAWSETLGLSFMMLGMLLLTLHHKGQCHQFLPLFFGLVAGGAYASRYALLPLFLLGLIVLFERESARQTMKNWVGVMAGFSIVATPLIFRNIYHSGEFRGSGVGETGVTVWGALSDLFRVFPQITKTNSVFTELVVIGIVIPIVVGIVILYRQGKLFSLIGGARNFFFEKRKIALVIWLAIYLGLLVYAETRTKLDPIDQRLALPALVVGVLLIGAIVGRLAYLAPKSTIMAAVFVAMLASYGEGLTAYQAGSMGVTKRHKSLPDDMEFLAKQISYGDLVIAKNGLFIPFYLGTVDTLYFDEGPTVSPVLLATYVGSREVFIVLPVKDDDKYFQSIPGIVLEECYSGDQRRILRGRAVMTASISE